jgi:hypothetical protein
MARGDAKTAPSYILNSLNGDYNLTTDTIAWSLVTDQYSSINVNAAGTLTMSDLTVVASAGNYTAGTALASKSLSRSGATITIDGDDISVAADAANPITARCLAFYNDTSSNDDVLCVVDITSDGSTAVDLTNGFTDTLNALGLIQVTVNA